MERIARVQKCYDDETALVYPADILCLQGCQGCAGCKKPAAIRAKNPIGAKPGQVVTVRKNAGFLWNLLLCLMPVILLLAGYGFWETVAKSGVFGGWISFFLGLLPGVLWKERVFYTITGFGKSL